MPAATDCMTHRRSPHRLAASCLLLAMYSGIAASADTLFDGFANPPISAHPWARWWWPGGAVQDTELRREIDLLKQAGFGGAEIQAFIVNLPHMTGDELKQLNEYATPAFFSHVAVAAAKARTQGLQIDATFGSAWPSGGGFSITPELALGELTMSQASVEGPAAAPIRIVIPKQTRKMTPAFSTFDPRNRDPGFADWKARFDARQHLIAVVAVKGTGPTFASHGVPFYPWSNVQQPGALVPGSAIVLTDKLQADGMLDWSPPPGAWQILTFKQEAVDQGILAAAGQGPQLVLDHFNKTAFDAHARRVGDPLDGVSDHAQMRATFIDSLETFPDLYWSDSFLDAFRQRRGYDLTPYLPLIVQPGWMEAWTSHYSAPYYDMGDLGDRVRADYRQTLSDLMIENFTSPFVAWNHAHHLQARYQAHGAPVDILRAYGLADMPETEDLMASADTHFLRLARSAADLYGRKLVSSESLCWIGHPYDITPAQWRQRADLLFVSGVTQIVEHGFPYRLHAEQWPGWYPFGASAFTPGFSSPFLETNPFWVAVPAFNGYIARMQSLLRATQNDVRVAVFYGEIGYYPGIEDQGSNAHVPGKALLAGGYDYDRINDDALRLSHVEGGVLVSPGGARFSAVVVPPIHALPVETARALAGFARQGLKIVFLDTLPDEDRGLADRAQRDQQVKDLLADLMAHGGKVFPASEAGMALRAAGVAPNLTFAKDTVLFIEKHAGTRTFYFLHNDSDEPRHVDVTMQATGSGEVWDAWNGTRASLPVQPAASGGTRVVLELPAGKSALIALDPGAAPVAAQTLSTGQVVNVADAGWTLSMDARGQSGRTITTSLPLDTLKDWRDLPGLADAAGQGIYRRALHIEPNLLRHGGRILLDLGEVHDIASVELNGTSGPLLIETPYRADITAMAKPGDNVLKVTVANPLQNAMLDPRKAGLRSLKLRPAGLIGPVSLRVED